MMKSIIYIVIEATKFVSIIAVISLVIAKLMIGEYISGFVGIILGGMSGVLLSVIDYSIDKYKIEKNEMKIKENALEAYGRKKEILYIRL